MKQFYPLPRFLVCTFFIFCINLTGFPQTTRIQSSVLPVPGLVTQGNKPPSAFPLLTEGSIAYGDNIQNSDFYMFDIDDASNWASVSATSFVSYSGDFARNDNNHMWILDGGNNYLKKSDISDGSVVDSVNTPCPLTDGVWTVISFHKATGLLYGIAASLNVADSRLYQIDIVDGTSIELMALGQLTIVSGTFDMSGALYAFDLDNDSIYDIDVYNQTMETLGYAGFDGNFSQGMGCNSETNEVYLAAFKASIAAELRLLDKNTGNTTFVSVLPGETTAFGFPVTASIPVFSVKNVYTGYGSATETGDTVWVYGNYTDTAVNILVESFSDWQTDQIMPPQSMLLIENGVPPMEAQNGGFIYVKGVLDYETIPDPTYPEDSLMAHLEMLEAFVLFEVYQDDAPGNKSGKIKSKGQGSAKDAECDTCKFAVLISGGWDNLNNKSKYWENLAALYQFKVDSHGYCKDNVFVHYYKGIRKDARIPQDRVFRADSAKIDASFIEISKRVAACTGAGQKATFQKMVTNHGESNGDIDLLKDEPELEPAHLRDLQKMIIDSCCSLVYDEFLQCYGGYCVDTMLTLDPMNKAKIYANSNADHQTGLSPNNRVHPYLQAKIDALDDGMDYEDAVVRAKLAYDDFLKLRVSQFHNWAQYLRTHPHVDNAANKLTKAIADSTTYASRICTSRNVAITPMKTYCQLEKFVVPPGGQLVLKFKGKNQHCGNVTVYKNGTDPENKYKVFNWNNPGSARYQAGNDQRVVNGDANDTTVFWVHNDDGEFVIRSSVNGNQDLNESISNPVEYPGTSFGGNNASYSEFTISSSSAIWIDDIDQIPFDLDNLPAYLGFGYTNSVGGSFTIDPNDVYATQMILHFDVAEVLTPGLLEVNSSGSFGFSQISINQPGEYEVILGDMTLEAPYAFIELSTSDGLFSIDCWGVHSVYQPVLFDVKMFLQGSYQDGEMQTGLNPDFLPLSQPFNTAPWNYPGNESVNSIPNSDVVDWVMIELRQAATPSLANPETVIGRRAAFLLNDGSIVDMDGNRNDAVPFAIPPIGPTSNLFLVVWHRNHLPVMAANPSFYMGDVITYDFTNGPGQAYGSNAMYDLGDGVFGMIGGDSNGDGIVNNLDKVNDWNQQTGDSGYLDSDLNLDGQSNNADKNEVWLQNLNLQTQVPQ